MRKNEVIIRALKTLTKMCDEHKWKWDMKPYGDDRVLVIIDVPQATIITHVGLTDVKQTVRELGVLYIMCLEVTA